MQSVSITTNVVSLNPAHPGCTWYNVICDNVYQWLATGRWFSPCTLVSSTNKSDCHDITEILLKVALNTKNQPTNQKYLPDWCDLDILWWSSSRLPLPLSLGIVSPDVSLWLSPGRLIGCWKKRKSSLLFIFYIFISDN